MILTVIKRDGRIVGFNEEKIKAGLKKNQLFYYFKKESKKMSTISSIKLNGTSYKIKGFDFNLVENNTPQQLDEFNIIYLTEEEY